MKRKIYVVLLSLLLLCLPLMQVQAASESEWHYDIEDGAVVIHGYYGDESGHVDIPSTLEGYPVTRIGNSAFLGSELTSVSFPDSVTVIGDFSFAHCPNLKRVNISEHVTFIDSGAFMDCDRLEGIWVDPRNWDYSSDEQGVLYSKNKMTLVQVPASFQGEFTVPEGVITVGFGAFEGCDSLTGIHLADSVRTISGYAFCSCSSLTRLSIPSLVEEIGLNAFESCTGLSSIDVAEDNRYFCTDENGNLCDKEKSKIVYVPGAFTGDYVVPQGTTEVGDNLFSNCPGLTSVTIPEGVTKIGHYAFYNCKSLQSVTLPESIREIDSYAFQFCENLTQINIPESITHIRWGLFRDCRRLTQLPIHDQVTIIDDFAFAECHSLTDIVIPASVEHIGHYAFFDCRGLQNVYFCGDAPEFVNHEGINGSFAETRANAYYHKGTKGWTEENMSKTGGYITWTELEHIVLEDGPDSCCVVCGEKAEKNTSVQDATADQPAATEDTALQHQKQADPVKNVDDPKPEENTKPAEEKTPMTATVGILVVMAAVAVGFVLKLLVFAG